jgi:predicted ArsR family transcriptional regulator
MPGDHGSLALLGETRAKIVDLLLDGAQTTHQLGATIKIHHTAVRAHLEGLERNGLVVSEFRHEGVGRPKKYYALTNDGRELLPRRYQLMLGLMLENLLKTHGRGEVERLMGALARDLASRLETPDPALPIEERVRKSVEALNDLGFRASVHKKDGRLAIVRSSCVFQRTAAEHHDLVCRVFDQELLRASVAGEADIRMVQSQAIGDCVCEHVVDIDTGKGHARMAGAK